MELLISTFLVLLIIFQKVVGRCQEKDLKKKSWNIGFTDLLQMEIQGEALNMFGKDLDQPRMEKKVIQEVEDLCVV